MQSIISITLGLYISSSIIYFLGLRRNRLKKASITLVGLGLLFNLFLLTMRTKLTGTLPLANGYDFLLTFTFFTVLMYFLYAAKYPVKGAGGPVMMIASLLLLVFSFLAPDQMTIASPLAPALKSPWLTIHVLTVAVAYSGFTLAAGLAIVQLKDINIMKQESVYRVVAMSFALLSLSIVCGAIWAEQAWGSYWSWDPKETWAMITWTVYAVYLHIHRQKEWRGKPANIIVIAGFVIVLFTFFGVTYLFNGLHSYS